MMERELITNNFSNHLNDLVIFHAKISNSSSFLNVRVCYFSKLNVESLGFCTVGCPKIYLQTSLWALGNYSEYFSDIYDIS